MIGDSLRIHEEFMLLCRNEGGRVIGNAQHAYIIAAAVLAELVLHNRVELQPVKRKTLVRLKDSRLIGDPVIDEALERIRTSKRTRAVSTWIGKIAGIRKMTQRVTERLWLSGLIKREERPFLFFFNRTLYPIGHPATRKRLVETLRVVITTNGVVEPRTAALLLCTHGNGVLTQVMDRKQLKPYKKRIKAVIEDHLIARELSKGLQASVQHYSPYP